MDSPFSRVPELAGAPSSHTGRNCQVSTAEAAWHAGFWIRLCLRRYWCQHYSTMASWRGCPGRTTPCLHRCATPNLQIHRRTSLVARRYAGAGTQASRASTTAYSPR